MANLIRYPAGRKRLTWIGVDCRRRDYYLGKMEDRKAKQLALYVDAIIGALIRGEPLPAEAVKVVERDKKLYRAVTRCGGTDDE